jgi:hypothetical protein
MNDNEDTTNIAFTNIIPIKNRLRDEYSQTYFEVIPKNIENLNEVYIFFTSKRHKEYNNIRADEIWYFYIRGGEVSRVNEVVTKSTSIRKVNFDILVHCCPEKFSQNSYY